MAAHQGKYKRISILIVYPLVLKGLLLQSSLACTYSANYGARMIALQGSLPLLKHGTASNRGSSEL